MASSVAVSLGATARAAERPVVRLNVHNHSEIAPDALARVQREVARIYQDAGVRIVWADATAAATADGTAPANPRRVTLWLVNITRDSNAGAAGCALGLGIAATSTAYVFVNRLLAATRDRPVDLPAVLAHAIAHEVGHVLLPPGPHSRYGLMRGDLDFSVTNPARFTREEAAALGRALQPRPLARERSAAAISAPRLCSEHRRASSAPEESHAPAIPAACAST